MKFKFYSIISFTLLTSSLVLANGTGTGPLRGNLLTADNGAGTGPLVISNLSEDWLLNGALKNNSIIKLKIDKDSLAIDKIKYSNASQLIDDIKAVASPIEVKILNTLSYDIGQDKVRAIKVEQSSANIEIEFKRALETNSSIQWQDVSSDLIINP